MSMHHLLSLLVALPLLLSCSQASPAATDSPTAAPTIERSVTLPASAIALSVQDMPVGWASAGSREEASGDLSGYLRSDLAQPIGSGAAKYVVTWVKVFPTIDEAKREFANRLTMAQQKTKVETRTVADSAFAYQFSDYFVVLQRKNVVAQVETGPALGSNEEEAVNWAKVLARKIP